MVKNSPANAGDEGSILRSGRSPEKGNGKSFPYSCLGNPRDRGARWATVHRVTKNQDLWDQNHLAERDWTRSYQHSPCWLAWTESYPLLFQIPQRHLCWQQDWKEKKKSHLDFKCKTLLKHVHGCQTSGCSKHPWELEGKVGYLHFLLLLLFVISLNFRTVSNVKNNPKHVKTVFSCVSYPACSIVKIWSGPCVITNDSIVKYYK